jgi:hypothetical protein
MPTILNFMNFFLFESRVIDRHHKDIFSPNSNEIASHATILNLVHFDICKLIQKNSWGEKHFISFIDEYLRYAYVYHFKH